MISEPLVSVCMPAFNHEAFVAEAINSVLAQDIEDVEIVVTDDGSTDGTFARIQAIGDPRIRLFRNERNLGPSATANLNVGRARGRFIAFLPSDDVFLPGKLAKQLEAFRREPALGAVFGWMLPVNQRGEPVTPVDPYFEPKGVNRESALRHMFHIGNIFSAPTAMVRRDLLLKVGTFDPCLWQTQDYDLWVRLCIAAPIHVLEGPLVAYRFLDGGANMHVSNPDTDARLAWELQKLRHRFLLLRDRDLLRRVLPETAPFLELDLPSTGALALAALGSPSKATRAFGVEALHAALCKPGEAEALEAAGYGNRFFFHKLAEIDPMQTRAIPDPGLVERHRNLISLYADLEKAYHTLSVMHGELNAVNQALVTEACELRDYSSQLIEAKNWWQSQAEAWEAVANPRR